jgi:putative transposase
MQRFEAVVKAYCLMGNHYHLVMQTRRANLSRLMRHINGIYSQAYNRRHGLVGHLFQGRFKAIHVDRDSYFLEVCRYVDLNPVRAGLVDEPSDWSWSSYRAHVGLASAPEWLDSRALHGHLLGRGVASDLDHVAARSMYQQFVHDGLDDPLWERGLRQEIYLGGSDFIETVQAHMRDAQIKSKDIAATQSRHPLAVRRDSAQPSREQRMLQAHVEGGQTLAVIAATWGLSV